MLLGRNILVRSQYGQKVILNNSWHQFAKHYGMAVFLHPMSFATKTSKLPLLFMFPLKFLRTAYYYFCHVKLAKIPQMGLTKQYKTQ